MLNDLVANGDFKLVTWIANIYFILAIVRLAHSSH